MLKSLSHMLLSGIFIKGGFDAFMEPGGRVALVEKSALPNPRLAVELNGVVMVVGGSMLALGIAPKLAAGLLVGSLVPTTIVGHAFWKEENAASHEMPFIQFLKNLGLIGGLLLILREKKE
jgi:putative oxidoreductase